MRFGFVFRNLWLQCFPPSIRISFISSSSPPRQLEVNSKFKGIPKGLETLFLVLKHLKNPIENFYTGLSQLFRQILSEHIYIITKSPACQNRQYGLSSSRSFRPFILLMQLSTKLTCVMSQATLSSQHAHKIAFGVVTTLPGNPPAIQMSASVT